MMWPVLDSLAEHVDHAAFSDLTLEAGQELPAARAIVFQVQPLEGIRLRFNDENEKLRQIDRVLAVVVVGRAADPASPTRGGGGFAFQPCLCYCDIAGTAGQGGADQPFEAAFAGVGRHHPAASSGVVSRPSLGSSSPSIKALVSPNGSISSSSS